MVHCHDAEVDRNVPTGRSEETDSTKITPFVVGIFGVSCSGKSTLAGGLKVQLEKKFNVKLIGQDDFYRPVAEMAVNPETGVPEFDDIKSLNMDLIIKTIKEEKLDEDNDFIIVEGSMIFVDSKIVDQCDLVFFIELDVKTVAARRSLRKYKIPDPPNFIEKYVWPKHVIHLAEFERNNKNKNWNVVRLDGRYQKQEIVEYVEFLMEQNLEQDSAINLSIAEGVVDCRQQNCTTRVKV